MGLSDAWNFPFPGSVYGKEDGTMGILAIAWWSVVGRDANQTGNKTREGGGVNTAIQYGAKNKKYSQ